MADETLMVEEELVAENPIIAYIEAQQEYTHEKLYETYRAIKEVAPDATERISWNMPTFTGKRDIIHFAANKGHVGIYPGSNAVSHFVAKLVDFKHSKGAFQFPYDKSLPIEVIKEIVAYNLEADKQR